MEVILVILLPIFLVWIVLSVLPPNIWFLAGLIIFAYNWLDAAFRIMPVAPRRGLNAWFSGAELITLWGTLLAAVMVTFAQLWRRSRRNTGRPTYYPQIVGGAGIGVTIFSAMSLGR